MESQFTAVLQGFRHGDPLAGSLVEADLPRVQQHLQRWATEHGNLPGAERITTLLRTAAEHGPGTRAGVERQLEIAAGRIQLVERSAARFDQAVAALEQYRQTHPGTPALDHGPVDALRRAHLDEAATTFDQHAEVGLHTAGNMAGNDLAWRSVQRQLDRVTSEAIGRLDVPGGTWYDHQQNLWHNTGEDMAAARVQTTANLHQALEEWQQQRPHTGSQQAGSQHTRPQR